MLYIDESATDLDSTEKMTKAEIENTYTYHAAKGNQLERYAAIRNKAKELATLIEWACPPSREQSLAFTNLQQAVQWANSSIAINESDNEGGTRIEKIRALAFGQRR